MSDTTWDECKCCRHDTDCIEGLCIECREYNYKLQKQVDLLTLGLLEEKRKMGDKPKCKTCNDTGVYEHTIVTGEILPVKCLHGAVKYPNAKPITEHPDVQRLIGQVVELQAELKAKDASLEASRKLVRMKDEVITAQAGSLKTRNEALIEYGTHGRSSDTTMCERDKHSDYPCTCGFEQALKGNQ